MAYKSIVEIAKEVRNELKKEFPSLEFSVTKDEYSMGQSLYVNWMKGFNPFVTQELLEHGYISINHFYIENESRITEEAKEVLKKVNEIANKNNWSRSDGYHTNKNYYFNLAIGKNTTDKKYQVTEAKPRSSGGYRRTSQTQKPAFEFGEKITDCGGWDIYKKTLPDGRVVHSAVKLKDTPLNKTDWATIKGEILTETGWKWSKWGKFERWGNISDQEKNIEKLCEILRKYYVNDQPEQKEIDESELRTLIAMLRQLEAEGNKIAGKQANALSLLIK